MVTGGGTGIGLAITRELLTLGCNVLIAARNGDRLASAAAALTQAGLPGRVAWAQADIRQPDQVQAMMDAAGRHFGGLDFLVNNGGGQFPSRAEGISPNGAWLSVFAASVLAT